MRTSVLTLAALFTLIAAAPRVEAQTHTASQAALDAALQQHVNTSTTDRDTVLRLLERDEVKKVPGEPGLDLRRAASAVATLEGQDLATVAAQARQVERGESIPWMPNLSSNGSNGNGNGSGNGAERQNGVAQ